jgi:Sodium:solute symporter family
MVAVGIAWIPVVQNFAELFNYIQSVTSFLAPPICAVYLLAVLWKRTNEQACIIMALIHSISYIIIIMNIFIFLK